MIAITIIIITITTITITITITTITITITIITIIISPARRGAGLRDPETRRTRRTAPKSYICTYTYIYIFNMDMYTYTYAHMQRHVADLRVQVLVASLLPSAWHLEQRRAGDEHVPCVDERGLVPVQEGKEQHPYVRAVHVGVGHEHYPAVAQSGCVELRALGAQTQGRYEGLQLRVLVDLVR
jgi:hypothetical protein